MINGLMVDIKERLSETIYSCGVIWSGDESSHSAISVSYIIFIYFLGFIFPLVIISTSYLKIIKTIRKVYGQDTFES